ncbi:MAG TPA: hypothetical protein VL993_01805, partial [Stellaceae bacterium]|nr:hypothetical protein [Stellaceae bacterium]
YGYLLEVNGVAVGMLLLISTSVRIDGKVRIRCHVSSWYVWPAFRAYGSLLAAHALKRKDVTYVDTSPLSHTFDMLAAQGFKRYCDGFFIAIPALKVRSPKARVSAVTPEIRPDRDLDEDEVDLLLGHAHYGLTCLVVTAGERRYPFVFEVTVKYRIVRFAYLTYCQNIDDFVRFAGLLGRYLARRGIAFVGVDANGPIHGLIGRYVTITPKYFKGPDPPRLGEVPYSERVVLGLRFPPTVEA